MDKTKGIVGVDFRFRVSRLHFTVLNSYRELIEIFQNAIVSSLRDFRYTKKSTDNVIAQFLAYHQYDAFGWSLLFEDDEKQTPDYFRYKANIW